MQEFKKGKKQGGKESMNYGKFSKEELGEVIAVLRQASSDNTTSTAKVANFLEGVISNMEKSREEFSMLMDRKECIGSILWTEPDVLKTLEEEGYEASEENLKEVLPQIDREELENCEHGWDVINDAVSKASKELKKNQ